MLLFWKIYVPIGMSKLISIDYRFILIKISEKILVYKSVNFLDKINTHDDTNDFE